MAESRREDEEQGERRHVRRGQTTDHPGRRSKPEHLHSCQGPLSSIRAAIKRTKGNSQSDNTRDRRRPEITIVSAEPLHPPTYDQVIKEKTEEGHTVRPTAAPRRTACTTSGTQTEPVREDAAPAVPQCTAATPLTEKTAAGKKPQKPPRPSVPKLPDRKQATDSVGKVSADATGLPNTKNENDSNCNVTQIVKEGSTHTSTRSVTVHWDTPTESLLFAIASAESTASALNSECSPHPIPRPRTKPQKQIIKEEAKVLVKLSGSCDDIQSDAQEVSSNKYLEELLEVFGAETGGKESSDIIDPQAEDAASEMNNNNSQRNIQARIQAFESQAGEEHVYEVIKPQPRPRMGVSKPPVSAKPSVALKPQFTQSEDEINHNNQNIPDAQQDSASVPRLQPPKKPSGFSIKEELESLHSKGAGPSGSRRPVLTRANTIDEDDAQSFQPSPPAKPVKEPLRPNLNINNHNSAAALRGNELVDSPPIQATFQSQRSEESKGAPFSRGSITKRPTTIRVPSRTGSISSDFQDNPPPLPSQRPVGSLVNHRQSLSFQDTTSSFGTQPSLPPRRHTVKKPPPIHPPPAKAGPGRPRAPGIHAIGRSQSAPWETSPAPQVQRSHMKGPVLPPRPNPGHRLYNKYTLQLPHGIASFDYNGSNTGELSFQKNNVLLLLDETDHDHFDCQVGETRGRVHKSRMKVITPLDMAPPQDAGAAASSGGELKVEALHDFFPEGPGELALRAGDVVTKVEQVDSQWYKGTCRGSAGFFPINYVKVLSNSPRGLPERKPRPIPAPVSGPRCSARFDFEGEHSDELSFSEGDVIQLKEYMGEDWARGQIGSVVGIFPLNFVEIIEDLPPPPSQQRQQPNRIALPGMVAAAPSAHPEVARPVQELQSGVEWAVAQYDYAGKSDNDLSFREGDCILITQHLDAEWSHGRLDGREGMFPTNFVKTNTDQELSNNQQNGATAGGRARALYNYASECDEELTLKVGDIVTNVESMDDEWYLGDLKGKRALVPKNYVQMLV